MSIPSELQHELQAVLGYHELGMWDEALAELDEIEQRHASLVPRVETGELRILVYQGAQRWPEMRCLAQEWAERERSRPAWFVSWAYALRREESICAARRVLERALSLHPNEPLISFNLACYDAQLGSLDEARRHLFRALRLDPGMRKTALADPDLEPLRADGGETLEPFSLPPQPSIQISEAMPEPPPLPAVSGLLGVYVRNIVEGNTATRAASLHALIEAKAEAIFTTLLAASDDPAVVEIAMRGLWECWFNEAGPGPRLVLEKGMAAMDGSKFELAEHCFRALIGQHPEWAEATNKLATLRCLEKRYRESLDLCRRVVLLKPDHFGAWHGMTLCAVQLGEMAVALEAARQSLRLQPRQESHREMVRSLEERLGTGSVNP